MQTIPDKRPEILIGVISDTHGEISQDVLNSLKEVSLIIHAGDLESPQDIERLKQIAPVKVVRGNMDQHKDLNHLPITEVVQVGEVSIYVLHNLEDLNINPAAAGFQVVIYGHTHYPAIKERRGVLFINPGSASFPRKGFAPSIVILHIQGENPHAELIKFKKD
jgi:hypothetical protein